MIANGPTGASRASAAGRAPLPFFLHVDSGELHPRTMEIIDQAAEIVEKGGIEAWSRAPLQKKFWVPRTPSTIPRAPTSSKSGSTRAPPSGMCCAARTPACTTTKALRPTCTWKATTSTAAGSIPRCCCPAPSLAARALPRAAHARLHRGRPGQEDEQVAGQHRLAAGGERQARRRNHPPVGAHRPTIRATWRIDDKILARGRCLPPHPQHAALSAGQRQRLRSGPGRRVEAELLEIDRWALARAPVPEPRCWRITRSTNSTPWSPSCSCSARKTWGLYLDVLKDRLYHGRQSLARRSAQTALWQITTPCCAGWHLSVVHGGRGLETVPASPTPSSWRPSRPCRRATPRLLAKWQHPRHPRRSEQGIENVRVGRRGQFAAGRGDA